ncbi:LysR family transcriptional regulator [Undibacterium sp. Di27W]|uniref:LysR family transcriptional regulator n=1 Tax=Undibacterium sp. Di27W TaxID=3413036 RepID=UPI003BF2EBCE
MSSTLSLADLELIRACAEERTLTAVAERMHKSLSTVSGRLLLIEEMLGETIAHRKPFHLTDAGEVILKTAVKIHEELRLMHDELRDRQTSQDRLKIMCSSVIMLNDLPLAVEILRTRFPSVRLDITSGSFSEIQTSVYEGTCDVGLLGPTPHTEGLSYMTYKTERLCIVAPADHQLAQGNGKINFIDTLHHQFIGMDISKRITEFVEHHADIAGLHIDYRVIISDFHAQIEMVAQTGYGIALVLESAANRAIRTGSPLKKIELLDNWAWGNFVCCTKENAPQKEVTRALLDILSMTPR